ncbi:MAG: hypothetical protein H6Q55_3837 [Deltaproteobacteria bacterium]|nr:hypothetical protein [Deltaproteobacteria bacterium]
MAHYRDLMEAIGTVVDGAGVLAGASCSLFSQPMDCEQSDRKIGRSPCQQSTTPSPRAADIWSRCVRRAPVDPRRARPEGSLSATASSLLIQRARQASVIQARPRPGQSRFPEVSEDHRFAGGSRWRGIRECMATVSPTAHAPRPIRPSGRRQRHATENLPGVHKPEDCCRRRSCAPSFIAHVEDLVPGCPREVRLQTVSLETGLSESEAAAALPLGKSPTEAFFDNGLHGTLLLVRQLSNFLVETVW